MSGVPDGLVRALADRYALARELGAGGMATVYLARDLKHDREVAIKVLHPDLGAALGGERFLAEIRTTAKLQHPHILPLLDSGDAGSGLLYYVMPYVRGETLRARLERDRQLPIAEAVRITREVADALQHAHTQGIIHRDIKPENILLQDGHALVADFGIALAVQQAGGQRMTQTGLSLGTPQYMSPEQAMGEKTIDARSDIYALGAVVYEMLAGEPPFTGASIQAIVARVMSERPTPIETLRDTVPSSIADAVMSTLAKLPADRPATARNFADALAADGTRTVQVSPSQRAGRWRAALWVAIGLALGVGGARMAWRETKPAAIHHRLFPAERRLFSDLRDGATVISTPRIVVSPDGRTLVYVDSSAGTSALWRKDASSDLPSRITGTEGAIAPYFSPDGAWVAFSTWQGELKKVSLASGQVVALAKDARTDVATAVWTSSGTIIYTTASWGLAAVPQSGGTPTALRIDKDVYASTVSLDTVPGGRFLLLTACSSNCNFGSGGFVYDLESGTMREIVPKATGIWYSPTGHVLYTLEEPGLLAAPFDERTATIRGDPVPVLDGVMPGGFTQSPAGTVVFSRETVDRSTERSLVWVARDGSETPVDSAWHGRFMYPAIAPDGRTLAVATIDRETDLWIRRADGSRTKVVAPGLARWRASWTDSGRALAFIAVQRRTDGEPQGVPYQLALSGGRPAEPIFPPMSPSVWEIEASRDGRWSAFRAGVGIGDLYIRELSDTSRAPLVPSDSASISQLALSPDGRWLAYTSTQTKRPEVWVASFPSLSVRQVVSQSGGSEPRWSGSGKELFFLTDGKLVVVPVSTDRGLSLGSARPLFPVTNYLHTQNRQHYDVTPDGQRFVMIRMKQTTGDEHLVLIENWLSELRAKLSR